MDNRDLLVCCLKIRNLDEFKPFREYLAAERDLALNSLIGSNDDKAMFRAQGGCRAIDRITELIEKAPQLLDKPRPANK